MAATPRTNPEDAEQAIDINDQLLTLNHQIRQTEHRLAIAHRRRKWSNISLVFGPLTLLILYTLLWFPWLSDRTLAAILIPSIPLAISFCISSFYLKRNPGGPLVQATDSEGQTFDVRESEGELELELNRQRDTRKLLVAMADVPPKVRRIAYKEDAYADIDKFRSESNKYRRINNILQGILIVGSLAATGVASLATELSLVRWVTPGITFVVGISSGFLGYFKYKERSFYLQQTADSIEHEWEAVEVGVGRYKRAENDEEALADFVEEVHRLKSEQKKRQQNLEQPAEARNPDDA